VPTVRSEATATGSSGTITIAAVGTIVKGQTNARAADDRACRIHILIQDRFRFHTCWAGIYWAVAQSLNRSQRHCAAVWAPGNGPAQFSLRCPHTGAALWKGGLSPGRWLCCRPPKASVQLLGTWFTHISTPTRRQTPIPASCHTIHGEGGALHTLHPPEPTRKGPRCECSRTTIRQPESCRFLSAHRRAPQASAVPSKLAVRRQFLGSHDTSCCLHSLWGSCRCRASSDLSQPLQCLTTACY
jgi:hypothetical protein